MDDLTRDLGSAPIDLLSITHSHSGHIGSAVDVLNHHDGGDSEEPRPTLRVTSSVGQRVASSRREAARP